MSPTALLFLLIYSVGFIFTFRSPSCGVFTAILLYFISPSQQWWYHQVPDLRYAFFINLAILISFALKYSDFKQASITQVPHLFWLMVLIFLAWLSTLVAVDLDTHYLFLWRITKSWIFIFLFYKVINSQKKLELAIGCYCLGAFYASYHAWEVGRKFGSRLEIIKLADGTDANGVAVAVLISIPFLIYYIIIGRNIAVRILSFVALIFNLNALILFNSRGAFLGLVCFVLYGTARILIDFKNFKLFSKMLIVLVLGVMIFFSVADDTFLNRMGTITQEADTENHISRILFWKKTFEMLDDHPLGLGSGGYVYLSSSYMPAEWLTNGKRAVHSTWFEVLASFGYQGLFAYIFYLLYCFKEIKKLRLEFVNCDNTIYYQAVCLECALIAYLIPSTFLGTFYVECSYYIPVFIAVFYQINFLSKRKVLC